MGMEFGIEKCTTQIMKSEKRESAESMKLPNQECIWTLGKKEDCDSRKILEADTIK